MDHAVSGVTVNSADLKINGCGCVPMKLYLHLQVAGQIWSLGYSLSVSELVHLIYDLKYGNKMLVSLTVSKQNALGGVFVFY